MFNTDKIPEYFAEAYSSWNDIHRPLKVKKHCTSLTVSYTATNWPKNHAVF